LDEAGKGARPSALTPVEERIGLRAGLSLAGPTFGRAASLGWGLVRYKCGKRGRSSSVEPVEAGPPPSDWAAAALASSTGLTPEFLQHSKRTWWFGKALAEVDEIELDTEMLYVAAMLHDIGLFEPRSGRCFTAVGADAARRTAASADVAADRAELVAHAISAHICPKRPRDALGHYLQAGSLLDVTGERIWDLDPVVVDAAYAKWPRVGFPPQVRGRWIAECQRFPHGRANYARWSGLLLAARFAPLPP
jgi:hypothetical protein